MTPGIVFMTGLAMAGRCAIPLFFIICWTIAMSIPFGGSAGTGVDVTVIVNEK